VNYERCRIIMTNKDIEALRLAPVGLTVEVEGKLIKVAESFFCNACLMYDSAIDKCNKMPCLAFDRADNRSVIYINTEK
jgi:hypothetical protein